MAQASAYGAAYNRLEIDGSDAGPLRSVEGGDPYGEVVPVDLRGGVTGKRIAAVDFSDIVIERGLSPGGPLGDWIRATLTQPFVRHGGAIVEYDRDFKEASRLRFQGAIIREIEFPALDAAGREPSYLTVRVGPESTQRQVGSGAAQPKDLDPVRSAKQPRSCDFRLQIDGLDTKRVSEVGPLVVRQVVGQQTVGEIRQYEVATSLEIGDLVVTLPEAADWYAWRDAFLLARTGTERNGSLDYLSPGGADVVARIEFSGLGIHSLVRERSDENPRAIRRVRASMYCRNLSFPVAPEPPPPTSDRDPASKRITRPSRVDVSVPLASDRVLADSRIRLS